MTATHRPEAGKQAGVKHTDRDRLLAAARELGPVLRAHADDTERERRLARLLGALPSAGSAPALRPGVRRAGGGSRHLRPGGGGDRAVRHRRRLGPPGGEHRRVVVPAPVAGRRRRDLRRRPRPLIAASFHPPHRAVAAPGGYRFTGRGPLASTIHDAAWVMMTGLVFDGDGRAMMAQRRRDGRAVLRDARRRDRRHLALARDARAPTATTSWRTTSSSRQARRSRFPRLRAAAQFSGPLYRFPALASVARGRRPGGARGRARGDHELRALARKTPIGSTQPLRDRATVQVARRRRGPAPRGAALFYETIDRRGGARRGEPLRLEQRADLLLAGTHAVRRRAGDGPDAPRSAARPGSTRGARSSATSATRRRSGITASCRRAGSSGGSGVPRRGAGVRARGALRVTLVHNPGAGDEQHSAKRILRELEEAGYDAQLAPARKGVEKALAIRETSWSSRGGRQHQEGRPCDRRARLPMAILPIGTANNIAKSLGSLGSVPEFIAGWRRAQRRRLAVGTVATRWGSMRFVESVGVGVFTGLVTRGRSEVNDSATG